MTPERHRQISELFHAAQAVEPGARAALVEAASLGDAELQREVTALLAAYPHAGEFLAALALESAAPQPTETPSLVGHRVAHYDVVALLGAGGMGEVYRARDARLGRDVAIKVLPDAFTRDADCVARFAREARVLASLNHPHIAALYGLEESGDRTFLVMELVEGPTLDERLVQGSKLTAHGSGLPQAEALHIAQQIAEALEAAHEKGIVHRDLKPSNVKVTPDNNVKLLDFGLAKGLANADVNVSSSPTLTTMATHAGVIMGTAAYMSPEQAKGGAVDRRTDIFAFGCLLYEMLTGRRAFEGDSVSEIVARVIEREPDWKALPPALPPRINELLRRCLEKDPKKRRRDIADVRMEIEHVLSGSAQAAAPLVDGAPRHRPRLAWVAATMVLIVALAVAIARPYFSRPAEALETRLDVSTPETPEPGGFAISPDGRRLVFVALRNGQAQLYVRSLDAETAQPLSGTEGARLPFWSSDGRSIGFFARSGELKRIELAGGRLQTLAQAVPGLGGTWGPDGTIVFAPTLTGPLFRVPASGGESVGVTKLGPGQDAHGFPLLLPGGRQFLFYVTGTVDVRGIYLGSLDSPDTTRLTDADMPGAYAPSGWLLFARQGALVARRFDLSRREMNGDPVTVAESVAAKVAVSATGVIAYRTGETTPRQLTWFDRSGQLLGTLGEPDRADLLNAALSPDGRQAAVQRRVENNLDVWLVDSARTTRFTFDPGIELYPTWSPDGTRLVFASSKAGGGLYQRASSAGSDELLAAYPPLKFPTDWSADGRFLMYFEIDTKAQPDLWVLPMDGDRKPFPFLRTGFSESWGEFSPNQRWVAYQSNESGRFEIYVRPFPPPGGQWRVSTSGGVYPRWSPDGKEVYYLAPDGTLMAAAVAAKGATLDVGVPATLFRTRIVGGGAFLVGGRQGYDVAKDGRFLINVEIGSAPPPITLVFNWKPPVNRN